MIFLLRVVSLTIYKPSRYDGDRRSVKQSNFHKLIILFVVYNCEFVTFHWYFGSGVVLECIDS